jgi:protein SCO1/2
MARMVESMNTAMPGEDFEIVTVSINPEERPIHAQSRKDTVIGMTGKPEAAEGWHFLTGEWNNIVALADSVGFRFTYEPRENEDPNIVHPAGIMILTPTGKVSRYFLSTEYPGQLVLNALEEAEQESIGIRDDNPVVLACIQIGVLNSDRTLNILNTLKLAGVLTIAIAAFSVGVMSINRKRKIYDKNKGGNGDAA